MVSWARQICKQLSKKAGSSGSSRRWMYPGSTEGTQRSDFQATACQKVLLPPLCLRHPRLQRFVIAVYPVLKGGTDLLPFVPLTPTLLLSTDIGGPQKYLLNVSIAMDSRLFLGLAAILVTLGWGLPRAETIPSVRLGLSEGRGHVFTLRQEAPPAQALPGRCTVRTST